MSDERPIEDLIREILDGGPASREPAAWERVVAEPDAAEAWEAAVARRRRIDAHAQLVLGRPWLARLCREVRRVARRVKSSHLAPALELAPGRLGHVLGPAEGSPLAVPLEVPWGETRSVSLPLGAVVTFADPSLTVRYETATGSGDLPTRTWELEPGDAPVALIARHGSDEEAPRAVVVLLQQD